MIKMMSTKNIDFIIHKSMGANISDKEVIENVNRTIKRLPQKVVSTPQSNSELEVESIKISRNDQLITYGTDCKTWW